MCSFKNTVIKFLIGSFLFDLTSGNMHDLGQSDHVGVLDKFFTKFKECEDGRLPSFLP